MRPTSNPQAGPSPKPPHPVPASPEAALALAAAGAAPPGWRRWPDAVLAPSVRVALLRAELVREPAAVLAHEDRGEVLYQAVRGVHARVETAGAVPGVYAGAPACVPELVRELAGAGDAVLEGEALRLAREGLRTGGLTSGFVREVLTRLADSSAEGVVQGALNELAEPWAAFEPLPHARLADLLAPSARSVPAATVEAVLTVAAAHGHGELLWWVASDADRLPPGVRGWALALYGEQARREDAAAVLDLAGVDPLLLAGPAVECLRAMHRRGHFVTDADVPAVLALALADHTVPAEAVATVLFTARHALLGLLVDAPPDDPEWPRRLDLLVALDGQGVGGLPVAGEIARLLPLAQAPGPFLRALRVLRDPRTEDAVLDALPYAPADALHALEAVGGARTVRVLGAGLGLDAVAPDDAPTTPEPALVERALRGHRKRALELVWLLNDDPDVRRQLLARVDAAELPARMAADLGGPDERELALLAAHLDPEQPVAALRRLAAHAGPGLLPALADLLLRIAGEAAAAWEPGGTGPVPGAEPVVPEEAVDALSSLGRRLRRRGRIRPGCLLDVFRDDDAGPALVTDVVLGLLERPALTAGEQAVLLRVLLDLPQAPVRMIRPRVHHLLRHPDRHVRKHVVALLARDTTGDGVAAVSATLLALTGPDRDPQTVRQTLSALGDAGARWASDAIAGCLAHPAMNVRKTAARALATAGTPRAVPALLDRLARDDNPGLRTHLLDALSALLGDTLTATVTAAADRATEAAARARLLAALAVGPEPERDETDLRHLTEEGWDPAAALRLAESRPCAVRLGATRPYLADWLELAATSAEARRAVLAVLPTEVCPAPWAAVERTVIARHVTVLLDGLAEAEGEVRDGILALLESVAERVADRAEVVAAVRALPVRGLGRRSALSLLRRAGAVVVRADLDRELACAARGSEPSEAGARVLREAFGVEAGEVSGSSRRGELALAVRSARTLAAFRGQARPAGSRELLAALVEVWGGASEDVRAALVDWMTELQPLDAPPWDLAEPEPVAVRPVDLDEPRSAARRDRLFALLTSGDPKRRNEDASALLAWPEPAPRAAVLAAYLRGRVDEPTAYDASKALAQALTEAAPESLRDPELRPERVARAARLAAGLDERRLRPLLPLLLDLWQHGPTEARSDAYTALRWLNGDDLAAHLEGRLVAGEVGLLELFADRRLQSTPLLARLAERHPDAGIVLVDGPPYGPEAAERQAAALRALRARAPAPVPDGSSLAYGELVALLRSPEPRRVRRALAALTERRGEAEPTLLEGELRVLLTHRETGVRLHAQRVARALLDRDAYLRLTEVLLGDAQPDVVRSAIRVLSQAGRRSAVPVFVTLLDHGRETVRRTAEAAVLHAGAEAVPPLRRAAAHARPDRRAVYESLLARIAEDG
ncbi:HEAT repeat domain-containing protein [Streptomyces sp. R302]|uniref:HEAT repeat domain-containing protein n=1 Tax=unclassified Streptomyces TaxID=2593676 RepID=UPI00145CB60E|nr:MULTISPECIES: HEAT repeat domain-containing protein [unclassified Streptomyces]NML54606.1 HEAT repeat domain-containing protein [Streptomyces sp. R301]NML82597.1 HEAT repeat domain-containing protein [Streptomyces sp. R302]